MSDNNIINFPNKQQEEDEECEFCKTVEFIIDFVKEQDYDACFDFISDVLNEFYMSGVLDVFTNIRDNCDNVVNEILTEIEE